jgi:hypothetical protein
MSTQLFLLISYFNVFLGFYFELLTLLVRTLVLCSEDDYVTGISSLPRFDHGVVSITYIYLYN